MSVDWLLFAALVALFLKIRRLRPWIPYPELQIDPVAHGKPIKELIVSESMIVLVTIVAPVITLTLLQLLTSSSDYPAPCPSLVKKYLFGLFLFFNAVLLLKLMVGRPRPNAIAIEEHFKQKKEEISMRMDRNLEARQSFPSAHSFLAAFASTFFAIVSHLLLGPGIYTATAQTFIFLLGVYPSTCQALTYWHHWSDVIVGHGIGVAGAIYSHFFML